MTAIEAQAHYAEELTRFEKIEILHSEKVYTIGSVRVNHLHEFCHQDGSYIPRQGEQLGYRYIIEKVLGAGAFG